MANINQLKQILGKSRALMKKVDDGDFTKGNIDTNIISEGTTGAVATPQKNITNLRPKTSQERYPNLEQSGLPQVVKDAMINNPIDIPEMPDFGGSSFELTQDIVEHVNSGDNITTQQEPIREINEQHIRNIVRSEMESFMEEYFDKAVIKEEVQIKVGNTVFSGSLKPLPKKKRK